jgi:hypothetical protein
MRKWAMPLTLLGISGVAFVLLTDRGRDRLRWLLSNLHRAPDAFLDWNAAAQRELDRIQTALNRVAQSLETAQ